jgi:hypothetical protein
MSEEPGISNSEICCKWTSVTQLVDNFHHALSNVQAATLAR